MSPSAPKIVILTAGAGGMYCGSCLHDNTLAAALIQMGIDVQLIPTYTPIRTDERNVSSDHVLLGGINVYLQQKLPFLRYTPEFLDRILDSPRLLLWAAQRGVRTTAAKLGPLTVSMLRGDRGNQRKEIRKLCAWLKQIEPSLINLSNILIGGCVSSLKRELGVPVLVTLQGDDIFLNELPPKFRQQALAEIRRIAKDVDGFITHSEYYADHMSDLLAIDRARMHVVPLGVNLASLMTAEADRPPRPRTIGYLARLAPEKGLHQLCDAFVQLRQQPATSDVHLRIAGWIGPQHQAYVDRCFRVLDKAGLKDAYTYEGEVDRHGKRNFLHRIDVLSVPSPYHEPKGIYILEALACGVPVVQPAHGAFPEIINRTQGGRLFTPGDSVDLVRVLRELLTDTTLRVSLGKAGQQQVHDRHSATAMARAVTQVMQQFVPEITTS